MSKQVIPSKMTAGGVIDLLTDEHVFLPNPIHRRAKVKFWARTDSLVGPPANLSLQQVIGITGEPALKTWWSLPGFQNWFLNQDEAKERLEYLFAIALDSAEHLLLDPDANANAKVQLIKVLATLAGKEPANEMKFLDDRIQKMGPEQLKEFIKSKTSK